MSVNLTITNNTGFDVYYLVWGFAAGISVDDADWSYLEQGGNNTSKLLKFPLPPHKPGASTSVVNLIASLKGTAGQNSVTFENLPNIISGNVFFSFKQRPAVFNTVPAWQSSGVPAKPHHGYGVQPPDYLPRTKDANTVFCSAEFTLKKTGISTDITDVDYFAAPITVEVNGSLGKQTSGRLKTGVTRDDVFSAFSSISDPKLEHFKKLVMTHDRSNVRVLAPGHGIGSNLFPPNYYDAYVRHCLGLYTKRDSLVVDIAGEQYKGTASKNTITFDTHGGSITLTPGNSKDIFLCNGEIAAPNNVAGAVAARIGAALNRTVLHLVSESQPVCDPRKFYCTTDESKEWWASNWYSKLLHDKMPKVYGFAFDDVCDNKDTNPLIHDPHPTSVKFVLESWS